MHIYLFTLLQVLGYFQFFVNNRCLPKINYTQSAVDLITKILSEENIHSSEKGKDTIKFDKEIIFNNVSFNYTENQTILKNFNLKIEKNSFVGIYGGGSGKSTFVDLLIGLIEPTKGEILLDGSDIKLFGKIT